jgi:hypothetical protein
VRRRSGWLTAAGSIAGAALLLGLAAASGPLFVSAAGTALLAAELESGG